jgi:glycerol-3-phosphate dehydrogenase
MNDTLARNRNNGVDPERCLPNGEILNADQTRKICPLIDPNGLKGGFVWYDACMPDSQRIVIELLRWACGNMASALNYVEAERLLLNDQKVQGVSTRDLENDETYEYKSDVVINAAGPWSRNFAAKFDEDKPELFISSIAWNVLFDKPAISSHALAVKPNKPKARTYFLLPWKGKLLAGTGHAPWRGGPENPVPNDAMLNSFIDDLNLALPALNVSSNNIQHIFSGLLPVKKIGSVNLTKREVILKHADYGGPRGFYSVSGVKFTTSRLVAEKTIKQIFPKSNVLESRSNILFKLSKDGANQRGILNLKEYSPSKIIEWETPLMSIIEDESVRQLDDLVFQRTNIWENPDAAELISQHFRYLFQNQHSKHNKDLMILGNKFIN